MNQHISKMEQWKDTFLILAGFGALVMGLAAYYQHQNSLIWGAAFTICASLAALHARWHVWFTRRLVFFGTVVTVVACAIWQYMAPPPEKLSPPVPKSYGQVLAPSELPAFKQESDTVTLSVGTNDFQMPVQALEGQHEAFFFFSDIDPHYSPIYLSLKDGKPYIDVTVWAGQNQPSVEIKQNAFVVRPLNWDFKYIENGS